MSTTLATINTLADDRRRDTGTASIDMTGDGFRAVNGALQLWTQLHDWPWQIASTQITYHEGITWYPISSSLNFKAVVDMIPYLPPERMRQLYYVSNTNFDNNTIQQWRFAINTTGLTQYLRLKYTGYNLTVNPITSVDQNGTWVGASAISNLAQNSYNTFDLPASLSFDYSGTSGTLTNSTMEQTDLSRYEKRSAFYLDIFLQSVTSFTSVTIKVGSDASNYITVTATTDYIGVTPIVGWNRFKFTWNGSTTTVGTPDVENMDYVEITIAYGSNPSTTGNAIQNLFVCEDVPMTFWYYNSNQTLDVSASNAQGQIFNDSSATGDLAMWTGTWDYVNEAFINSVMEIISWITGETDDRAVAVERIAAFVKPLQARLPSRRRYPEMHMVAEVNVSQGGYPYPYRRNYPYT